ncbi:MAG TPA: DCC1-like thiol-disulfide oxidoreductase family protein [Roseiflexaceae bacterium]|nr:DCC1-like thiol-disulfide oxidoreductase family protein [Roseiflexaceae bacterium]HMP39508.1 DCC1-like thiol-disulfide oxidoreductase family protein [Roseiflexaceae bacterium]
MLIIAVGMPAQGDRVALSRLALGLGAAALGSMVLARRDHVGRLIHAFFAATTSPFNLAIVRIVFFATLLIWFDSTQVRFFSRLPAELLVGPVGLRWLPDVLPIITNEPLAQIASSLLLVCCFMAMIGLLTRFSAAATVVLALYVLLIPQFYGKVNHYHHLIWFGAILAASRCGDVLSIDAIRQAWQRADRGLLAPPPVSQQYALPLRFIWLLIGLIYFFPGFWKFWTSGIDWIVSHNLQYHMYAKWLEIGGWTPEFFRIDQYPLLYQSAAAATIGFELSFIFLLFVPQIRLVLAAGGVMFHTMLAIFMRITLFWTLQTIYVSFVDWKRLCERLGRRFFPQTLYLVYDGNCRLCRRTVGTLRSLDLCGRIEYVDLFDDDAIRRAGLEWLEQAALLHDMHVVRGQQVWRGFAAYRILAGRIPPLWPLIPLLYLWPVTQIGAALYRRVADTRTCQVVRAAPPADEAAAVVPRRSAVVVVGVLLLVLNACVALIGASNTWPFAGYPKFERIAGPQVTSLMITAVGRDTSEVVVDNQELIEEFSSERWAGMVWHLLNNDRLGPQPERLAALGRLVLAHDRALTQAVAFRFYKVELTTIPEQRDANPLQRELLYEWQRP